MMRGRNRIAPFALVVLGAALIVQADAAPAQTGPETPERLGFVERTGYMLRNGGRWEAANPTHDPAQPRSPRSFGYEFLPGASPGSVRLRITGQLGGETVLYWDGFYFWHPLRNRAVYSSLSTGGPIAIGETVDAAGTLVFDVIFPDGRVELHRDTESRDGPDRFVSRSFRYVDGGWQSNQTLIWQRRPATPPG